MKQENKIPNKRIDGSNFKVLLNGSTLYWEENEVGGRTYYSDEVGLYGGIVWDTSLISKETLEAALIHEGSNKENRILNILKKIEDNDPELLREVANRLLEDFKR